VAPTTAIFISMILIFCQQKYYIYPFKKLTPMRLIYIIGILLFLTFMANAQIQDDFSDGDFTNNPTWSGDDTQFKINSSKKLQLNSSGTDTSYLSTANSLVNNTEWRFYIKQSFNSSSNNHSRIYLISDQSNLKTNLNGYFVQFGSTQDDICLYRQDGNTTTKIISGTYGNTGNSVNTFTLKVTRDANGNWELFSDDQAGSNFHSEGTATDLTYSSTSYFGLWCKYTSSNSTKIYFDDVYVGTIVVDTIRPVLQKAQLQDSIHLNLYFSEALDPTNISNTSNYLCPANGGQALAATLDPNNNSIIQLTYPPFSEGVSYQINVSNIKDLSGNTILSGSSATFVWHIVRQYDILINEIMADPAPIVGLPDAEYIELFNDSYSISLKDWTLQIGKTIKTLPDSTIKGGGYILIGHTKNETALSPYGSFIGLSSFSLTNAGQQIILKNEKGEIIHQVYYQQTWYQDKNKEDGGWSLEQIDAKNPCGCEHNWKASTDSKGGTPGVKNAISASNPDKTKPQAIRVSVVNSKELLIYFSEPMDSISILDVSKYEVLNFGNPIQVLGSFPNYRSINLIFANSFMPQKIYELKLHQGPKDCVGNDLDNSNLLLFGLPEMPDSNDVVINEILFNPQSQGVDYVEIYNRSDKIIDLKNLRLANWDSEIQNLSNVKELAPDGYLIFPKEYYVFSTNSAIIKKQYFVKKPENMIEIPSMISMANTAGNVLLITGGFQLIDRLDYTEDMQYALIQDPKGISLERLNYNRSSSDRGNWHSAATSGDNYSQSSDYAGTPTYQNSQFITGMEFQGEVWLDQEIFSPDNDGYQDVLNIQYKFPDAGYVGNTMIYDSHGKLIKNLINNELLETEGIITWDGLDNQNHKANIGMYIIYFEVFNLKGDVQHYKLSTVLGGRL
jgi:hypothetical protein